MNYIKHLNAVFKKFSRDLRLNPTHISLYMALFQLWNISRFPPIYYINREEVMTIAKIGSKGAYHRCLKNLHHWNYILYFPSHNPYKSSRVRLLIFDPTHETSYDPTPEHAMGQFGLSKDDINLIQEVFSSYDQIEEVLIYGSRAMGNFKPSSDIDLSLLGSKIDLSLQQQIEFDLDDLMLPYKFDVSVYDRISNPEFLNHIQRVGKEFYKRTEV